jgi:hypothetical protein
MMITELKKELEEEYLRWVRQKIKWDTNDDFIEIITPFVDMHHDYISLFLSRSEKGFKLSDDGYIVDELDDLGVNVQTSTKRKHFFNTTLRNFGVKFSENTQELYINFDDTRQYPEMQQRLIQCIIRVSDMLISSRNKVINFFSEDIAEFFVNNQIMFIESASFIGRSGRNITFDFVLPKSKNIKPKLIQAVNNPTSDAYKDPLLSFIDVQESKSDHVFYVLANDINLSISDKFVQALENYDIGVLPWSKRKDWLELLKTS